MGKPRAILIAGPTAGGKSAVALALAERLGGVVVNADSMQVYRELRVLTARPAPEEEKRVPHALYGFVPAAEAYSAGRWIADMEAVLKDAKDAGRIPIVTGGTGLYFKALLEGLSPVPGIPDNVRRHWREESERLGGPGLHAVLAERDPAMADRLRPSDPQRIVRALEVLEATGRSLAGWQREKGAPLLMEEDTARFVVAPERTALNARIDDRFGRMLEQGALDEVRLLASQRLDPGLPVMRALGVRPLMAHLAGALSLEEAAKRARSESRRYAKRQMTWVRSNMIAWSIIKKKDSKSLISKIFSMIDV